MLPNGKWARKHDCCIECGTTEIKHKAKGFCLECYSKLKEKIKVPSKKWSYKYICCIKCGTTKKRHKGHGLCKTCFSSKRYKDNPEINKAQKKKSYNKNPKKYSEKAKAYYRSNPKIREKKKIYNKKYQKEHKVRIAYISKRWNSENKEKMQEWTKEWTKKRKIENPQFKIKGTVSTYIYNRLKKRLLSKKGKRTWDFLPYTVDELIQHLEKLFTKGMTWENYGMHGWHIDHKRPDCSFDYKSVDDEEFQKCWALNNLQPLWAVDNFKKGGKWDGQ